MKRFLLLAWMLVMAVPSMAHAGRADHFKGIYAVSSPAAPPEQTDPNFVLIDNDRLEKIWGDYFAGELPADLVPLKDEQTVLVVVRLNNVATPFLRLDAGVIATPTYLAIGGVERSMFEMQRAGDGTSNVAMELAGQVIRLRLAAPLPLETSQQLGIASLHLVD